MLLALGGVIEKKEQPVRAVWPKHHQLDLSARSTYDERARNIFFCPCVHIYMPWAYFPSFFCWLCDLAVLFPFLSML